MYIYMKMLTTCLFANVCHYIFLGHTRQGLRCRMCKMNIHPDCQEKVDKCQPKTRLLRRQRSTSELETRLSQMADPQEGEDTGDGGGGNSSREQPSAPSILMAAAKAASSKGNSPGGSKKDTILCIFKL